MNRTVTSLAFVLIIASAGCATLPPLPPLAEPIGAQPERREFHPKAFVWSPGMTVSYNVVEYSETRVADRITTTSKQAVQRLQAHDRTATGLVRVRASIDNTELVDLFFSGSGLVVDAVALDAVPAAFRDDVAKTITHAWQHPTVKRFMNATFEQGTPIAFDLSLSEAFGPLGRFFSGGMVSMQTTFAGWRRVGGAEAAELRMAASTSAFTVQIIHNNRTFGSSVSAAHGERVEYHADNGLLLATYETITLLWDVPRKGSVTRMIAVTTLDRAGSRGI